MKCPICNLEMISGGIITEDVSPMWVPLEEFNKRGIKRLMYSKGLKIGNSNVLIGQTKIPNAFFCPKCNKIIGMFDVDNKSESEDQ